jgi:hypothetical protein
VVSGARGFTQVVSGTRGFHYDKVSGGCDWEARTAGTRAATN